MLSAIHKVALRVEVSFPLDVAFLAAGPSSLSSPGVDLRIPNALAADPQLGISGTLIIVRINP